jgi:hypothetical protein
MSVHHGDTESTAFFGTFASRSMVMAGGRWSARAECCATNGMKDMGEGGAVAPPAAIEQACAAATE